MKFFGITLSENKQDKVAEPIYTRFEKPQLARTTRQVTRHERASYLNEAQAAAPKPAFAPRAPISDDRVDPSVLHAALPKRFDALRSEVMDRARKAAQELAEPKH